jgi:membrane associated rhomboid family serine protease
MFPISDDNPRQRLPVPYVTWGLMGLNCLAFLWQVALPPEAAERAIYAFGMIPAVVFGVSELQPGLAQIPGWATVVTSMFLHGGILHLAGNMLFLWIFGDNVEDALGSVRFAIFYLLCGIAAALTQGLLDIGSTIPMIGASGAVSGVLGAYCLLYPRANVRTVLFLGFFATLLHVPALLVLGLWFVGQLVSGALTPPGEAGVAFWAHIGGFVAGLALIPVFRRADRRLMQPPRSRAWSRETRRGPWGPRPD